MDDNFDVDKFAALVEKKESIWNYKCRAYNNKTQRREDWMSVCEAMVPDFKEKSVGEKCATALEYQAKWKVLRDGFTRSLKNYIRKAERNTTCKLYAYYDQLHFLMDLYEEKSSIIDEQELKRKRRKRSKKDVVNPSLIQEADEPVSQEEIPHSSTNLEPISTIYSNPEEDKQFLLSLLSDFRKIPEDQKLDCKGDIINVIRHYRNTSAARLETRGSYYSNDIAALATTAIESTNSHGSSFFEKIKKFENGDDSSRDSSTLADIKLFNN